MIRELILKNRSYRRFYQEVAIELETLRELVDLARLSASAANRQPLKYILSADPQKNALIFPHLSWAGYLKDWPGPSEGERSS
ncbi:MAG: nitroreductase family protein, partial [Dehalococcoidales bacterium]|nr:nitroreductase family protein [Dehalococcoidales bacterium]